VATLTKGDSTRPVEMDTRTREETLGTSSQGTTKVAIWLDLAAWAQPPPLGEQAAWDLQPTWVVTQATTTWVEDPPPLLGTPTSQQLGTWEVETSTARPHLSSSTTTSPLKQHNSNSSDNQDNSRVTSSNTPRTTATSPSSSTQEVLVVSQPAGTVVARAGVLVGTTSNNLVGTIRWEDRATTRLPEEVVTINQVPTQLGALAGTIRVKVATTKEDKVTNPLREGSLGAREADSRVVISRVHTTKVVARVVTTREDEVVTKGAAVVTRHLAEEAASEETAAEVAEEGEVEEVAPATSVKYGMWRTRLIQLSNWNIH